MLHWVVVVLLAAVVTAGLVTATAILLAARDLSHRTPRKARWNSL